MPRAIQQLLPPTPVKKATLLPPKPNPAAQPHEQVEDFRHALKTARQKNEEASQPDPNSPKAEATKKTTGKQETKATAKTKGKPAPMDSDAPTDAEETTAEDQTQIAAQLTPEADAQARQAEDAHAPDEKSVDSHDPHPHPDHADPEAATSDALAAQLIRPVDRAKDETPKNPKEQKPPNGDVVEAVPQDGQATATSSLGSVATPAEPATDNAAQPTAKRPKDDANPTTTNTQLATDAQTQQAAATVAAQATSAATNPSNNPASSATAADQSTQPKAPIVSALGTAPAPIQPPTNAQSATPVDRATAPSNVDLPLDLDSATEDVLPDDVATDDTPAHKTAAAPDIDLDPAAHLAADTAHHPGETSVQSTKLPDPTPTPPEVDFAQTNHDRIVTGVHSQLLPHGGAMEIRLDPPELGALKVMVEMRDGVMNATFQTSNEQATQLLSHSLNQLKHVLESQGVSVERIQVQQAPKNEHTQSDGDRQQQQQQQQRDMNDDHAARQERQRKEMMRRMWRRVSGAGDPIDYMA